jgi:hypothetical protein
MSGVMPAAVWSSAFRSVASVTFRRPVSERTVRLKPIIFRIAGALHVAARTLRVRLLLLGFAFVS